MSDQPTAIPRKTPNEQKDAVSSWIPQEIYQTPIEQLDLSERVFNSLKRTGITNVGEVLEMLASGEDAMLTIRNFGTKSYLELKEKLVAEGFLKEDEVLPGEAPGAPIQIGSTFALNDRPRGDDRLGFTDYARAFAAMLSNPATQPPLTIGIYGAWGMGKSFLIRMIREALENDKPADAPEFSFVEFNAWVYSGSDNLWAGLVSHIYERIEQRLGSNATRSFRLDRKRRKQVRRLSFYAILYAIPIIAVTVLLSLDQIAKIWADLPGLALLGVSSFLALIVGFVRTIKSIYDIVKKAIVERAEQLRQEAAQPDFRTKIGFMADVKAEIDFVTELLAHQSKGKSIRVVIFIDGLDRCPPAKAVEVLEAIMLLLSEDNSPFYVFLGIDARVLVRAIEDRYGKTLVEAGISGYEYLDKIVQIPFTIPATDETGIKNYIRALLPRPGEESARALVRPTAPQASTPQAETPPPAVEVSFTDDEQMAFDDFAKYISRNPRRAKRIVNIYRLVRMLDKRSQSGLTAERAGQLIKWVILTEQWPYRMGLIISQRENAGQLGEGIGSEDTDTLANLYTAVADKLHGEESRRLLYLDDDAELFTNFITHDPTQITAADICTFEPLTFNLNPAIGGEIRSMLARATAIVTQANEVDSKKDRSDPAYTGQDAMAGKTENERNRG
ncbi:MAG TPA: P-loop NTPase fold protein [Anaerolineae bacterium]|nr:P-loop NTPase fold protein [Anaerolineae bacterium]